MTRTEKEEVIKDLTGQLNDAANFYLTDISELTVEDNNKLRRSCFKQGVSLQMVKNTLLKKAFEQSDKELEELYDLLKGSTSVMITETGNAPAKLIKEFRKKQKKERPLLKAAYVEEAIYIGNDKLEFLETIKSKNELIADVIALLQSPAKNVVSQLQSGGQTIAGVLKTLSEKEN